jgi:uncharacterized Zn-finger protein
MAIQVTMIGISGPPNGQIYPQFRNNGGVHRIRVGTREFECIGQSPPLDHPHVYLEMGLNDEILCPYCSTLFEFDPSLETFAAIPADSILRVEGAGSRAAKS